MADERAKRIAELIKPLKVKPGTKVNPARDFDPGYKAGFLTKKDGAGLPQTGIELLADYQRRLAAQDTYGVLNPRYPQVSADRRQQPLAVKAELGKQAPEGAPAGPFAGRKARTAARDRSGTGTQGRAAQASPRAGRAGAKGQQISGSEA